MLFDDELVMNHRYQSFDSQPKERKIKQLNGDYMFKSSAIHHSPNSRMLHGDNEIILTNNDDYQSFHQPNTRKITKITPKETVRVIPVRSTSTTNGSSSRHELNDIQRLKNVRRHEPVPVPSGPESKKFLITPDSWKTHPVQFKTPANKKPTTEIVNKPEKSKAIVRQQQEQPVIEKKPRVEKAKRARSATKPPVEEVPVKKPTREKSKEEKEKLQKYIREKREEHEKSLSNERNLMKLQEKDRKEKLKKLNEQIKKVAPIPIPASLLKKSSSTHTVPKDHSEQTRQRLLDLLGPKINIEPPTEYHRNTPFEQPSIIRERSPSIASSTSTSSDSVVEIQPPRIPQPVIRSHSESHAQNHTEQRHQNILRWAMNLTRDCDDVENKFKFFRPDGTQPFDIIPPSRQVLQHQDGNLRVQPPVIITNNQNNNNNNQSKPVIPSKVLRPSGRLSRLNQNQTSEYQNQQLPGVGNLRDPSLERRIKHDRAAIKIQAAYRGYNVRKSLQWINQNEQRLKHESNKRPGRKSTKARHTTKESLDIPPINLDLRFSEDNFTIGSTLLRNFQRNGMNILPSTKPPVISEQPQPQREQKIQRPPSIQNYSDDYENVTSTRSSTPPKQKPKPKPKQKQIPEKPRVIQQPVPKAESSSSESTSSSSSVTPTPTSEPRVPTNIQRRRSISPPLPPQMSSDNGRPIRYQPPPPAPAPPTTTTTIIIPTPRKVFDEPRYSPDALERQLNAELNLLDGVEASMKQIENMERLRSVALAQQEVVSLAQVLRNKPHDDTLRQQSTRKSPPRQVSSSSPSSSSSSSSSSYDRRRPSSPPPNARRRPTHTKNSSPESVLTEREKDVRQKPQDPNELQAYEKRLKEVENKLHSLSKRDNKNDHRQAESISDAFDIYDQKQTISKPRTKPKSSNESSISEDIPESHKSTTSISTVTSIRRKPSNDLSEIHTEPNNISSRSIHDEQPDSITTDASDIERRVRTLENQVTKKKTEVDKLKKQKDKEELRRKEEELKKQFQTYNQELEKLRTQPTKTTTPIRKPPAPSKSSTSSSSSGTSTPTKPQESSIAEDLPAVTTTASKSEPKVLEKRIEETRPKVIKKERDFFDDDEEEEEKPPVNLKPLITPRDEQNTQHDALSISTTTDIAGGSESDNDDSRRQSTDHEKPILNFNTNPTSPLKTKAEFETSSSSTTTSTSEKVSKQPVQRKVSPVANDYDEDFSEVTHSHNTPSPKEPEAKPHIDDIDIESIQEDIENKPSVHDNTNQSLSSKSSNEEQSEILVLNKKSTPNTPRKQDDKTPDDDFFLPPPSTPRPISIPEPKVELINVNSNNNKSVNDDTSHDVSEDEEGEEQEEEEEEEEVIDQETKIDTLTELFLRTFIDEAIDKGKQIEHSKKEDNQKKQLSLTQQIKQPFVEDTPRPIEPTTTTELNPFTIDLSGINDEPRVESPRKPVIEEVIKPFVPHTREQVTELCHQAVQILLDQNKDFSDRTNIQCRIPNAYFTYGQQDSDTEDIRCNRHAYCRMVFDLCLEILHEMDSSNVQSPKYPQWQKTKLVSKRFYRGKRPPNRHETEQIIQTKVLEILNLMPRQITYSKWRVSNNRRAGMENFEVVLEEEIRRSESQWINYDDDGIQIKFDVSDLILDQLVQETLTDCLDVVNKRLFLNSDSTRL